MFLPINKNKKSLSLFKLINTYCLKNKVGLIISFLIPFLFMIIFFIISQNFKTPKLYTVNQTWEQMNNHEYFTNSLPVFLTFAICPLSMLCIPNMNIEFRNSIVLKNIKANKISKYKYSGIVFGYFMLMSSFSVMSTIILFLLFLINNFNALSEMNWLSIMFGSLCLMISSIIFSLFISNFIKNSFGAQILGFGIIILSIGFSGRFMPIELIDKIQPLKYINYFSPLGFSQNTICLGSFNNFIGNYNGEMYHSSNNVFNWNRNHYFWYWNCVPKSYYPEIIPPVNVNFLFFKEPTLVYHKWEKPLDVFIPFLMSGMYFWLSTYFFKWSNR